MQSLSLSKARGQWLAPVRSALKKVIFKNVEQTNGCPSYHFILDFSSPTADENESGVTCIYNSSRHRNCPKGHSLEHKISRRAMWKYISHNRNCPKSVTPIQILSYKDPDKAPRAPLLGLLLILCPPSVHRPPLLMYKVHRVLN